MNDEGNYGINEVHYQECDPSVKGSQITAKSPMAIEGGGNFLPDLKIEDLEPQSSHHHTRKQ